MKIHFICRGNVFRSFIAETYLRSLELQGVSTYSSGTVAERYKTANKQNHEVVQAVLREQGLSQYMKADYGEQLTQQKLDEADINVFVYPVSHQEAIDAGLDIPSNVKVWNIADFDLLDNPNPTSEEDKQFVLDSFPLITTEVDTLVD